MPGNKFTLLGTNISHLLEKENHLPFVPWEKDMLVSKRVLHPEKINGWNLQITHLERKMI